MNSKQNDGKDFFRELEKCGAYTEKELENLIKSSKNTEAVKLLDRLKSDLNGDENFVRIDCNSESAAILYRLSEIVENFNIITETDEEDYETGEPVCCYSPGLRYVNRTNFFVSKEPLKEDFCDYD